MALRQVVAEGHVSAPARRVWRCALLACLGAAAGCASVRGAPADGASRSASDVVFLQVTNDRYDDLVVHVIRGSTPLPLGIVPGLSSRAFVLSPGVLGSGTDLAFAVGRRGKPLERTAATITLGSERRLSWRISAGRALLPPAPVPQRPPPLRPL